MATANKEDILLRQESNAPLSTKGSAFTFKNLDDNFITLYNQLVALSTSSNVDAYSASVAYSATNGNKYAIQSNQLYECVSATEIINEAPSDYPAKWSAVYASDLVQAPNDVRKFRKVIAAADVLTLGYVSSPVTLVEAAGANKAIIMLSAEATVDFETGSPSGTPYATATTLYIYNEGIDVAAGETANASCSSVLAAEIPKTQNFSFPSIAASATRNDNAANSAIKIGSGASNPTAGDSDIIITGTYKIIDISN